MQEIALLEMIAAVHRRRSADRIRRFGITLLQFRLIQLARQRGAIAPSLAAQELSCDRPTATLVAQKCVAAGWLIRKKSEADRRSSLLELTGEGEELLDRIEAAKVFSSLGDPFAVLGVEERQGLLAALEKVSVRLKELDREGHAPPGDSASIEREGLPRLH